MGSETYEAGDVVALLTRGKTAWPRLVFCPKCRRFFRLDIQAERVDCTGCGTFSEEAALLNRACTEDKRDPKARRRYRVFLKRWLASLPKVGAPFTMPRTLADYLNPAPTKANPAPTKAKQRTRKRVRA